MEEAQHSRSAEHSWFQLGQKDACTRSRCPARQEPPADGRDRGGRARPVGDKLQKRCQHVYGKCDGYREVKTFVRRSARPSGRQGTLDAGVAGRDAPWTGWRSELGLYPVIRKSSSLVPVAPPRSQLNGWPTDPGGRRHGLHPGSGVDRELFRERPVRAEGYPALGPETGRPRTPRGSAPSRRCGCPLSTRCSLPVRIGAGRLSAPTWAPVRPIALPST